MFPPFSLFTPHCILFSSILAKFLPTHLFLFHTDVLFSNFFHYAITPSMLPPLNFSPPSLNHNTWTTVVSAYQAALLLQEKKLSQSETETEVSQFLKWLAYSSIICLSGKSGCVQQGISHDNGNKIIFPQTRLCVTRNRSDLFGMVGKQSEKTFSHLVRVGRDCYVVTLSI